MLYDFSRACGINPQVMLVTLQKESQGLTRTDPTASTYAAAWGWHCPDTGPGGSANCDPLSLSTMVGPTVSGLSGPTP